ncbi:hypothetical protein D3C73_1522940 [compost metagenome]
MGDQHGVDVLHRFTDCVQRHGGGDSAVDQQGEISSIEKRIIIEISFGKRPARTQHLQT